MLSKRPPRVLSMAGSQTRLSLMKRVLTISRHGHIQGCLEDTKPHPHLPCPIQHSSLSPSVSIGGLAPFPYSSNHLITTTPTSSMSHVLTTGSGPRRRDLGSGRPNRARIPSMHWLFRTNIPRKRTSYIQPDIRKRNLFGMSEIFGVLANPAETVRSLTESRKMLEEARQELRESRERSQLRPKHTFSRLPGFYARKAEVQALERALSGEPSFTVLFGASSTGKTALLREVLSSEKYHVLHFDLRISGFADLASLYMSLSQQMEMYFETVSQTHEGYEDFEKEAWAFKHDRIDVEKRIMDAPSDSRHRNVKTSDIARLMELFQSSLLKYWEFRPETEEDSQQPNREGKQRQRDSSDNLSSQTEPNISKGLKSKSRFTLPRSWRTKPREQPRRLDPAPPSQEPKARNIPTFPPKIPVFFLDEAHKLPALIQSPETMKCLLDSMLVLTKQDRLCHIIHATSDPFYQTWLRQLNVMQHCKIMTIGDCSKSETRSFFREMILPRVPERLRPGLNFEMLYDAFGGKLAHWQDYVNDYVNSNGRMDIKQSSHFLQAHALLNLHIIHSSQTSAAQEAAETAAAANRSNPETLHPGLGPAGFKIYSPISTVHNPTLGEDSDRHNTLMAGVYSPEFSAMQLLKVMSRLTQPDTDYIPYFLLCRELGVRAVDGMIKGRLLDLRWTETITKEGVEEHERVRSVASGYRTFTDSGVGSAPHLVNQGTAAGSSTLLNTTGHHGQGSSATAVEELDESMEPISMHEPESPAGPRDMYEEVMEVVGPKLLPTTPIMRFAMRDVVEEYEDNGSVSDYASFQDPEEY